MNPVKCCGIFSIFIHYYLTLSYCTTICPNPWSNNQNIWATSDFSIFWWNNSIWIPDCSKRTNNIWHKSSWTFHKCFNTSVTWFQIWSPRMILMPKFLILSKMVVKPNGFLGGKTVGIRFLFFYVTQLYVTWKIARAPAAATTKI